MTLQEYAKLPKEQRSALAKVWNRKAKTNPANYRLFIEQVQQGCDCIMLPWANMWLGIEADGYIHS